MCFIRLSYSRSLKADVMPNQLRKLTFELHTYYFKFFLLDAWEVHLYETIPSLSTSTWLRFFSIFFFSFFLFPFLYDSEANTYAFHACFPPRQLQCYQRSFFLSTFYVQYLGNHTFIVGCEHPPWGFGRLPQQGMETLHQRRMGGKFWASW